MIQERTILSVLSLRSSTVVDSTLLTIESCTRILDTICPLHACVLLEDVLERAESGKEVATEAGDDVVLGLDIGAGVLAVESVGVRLKVGLVDLQLM